MSLVPRWFSRFPKPSRKAGDLFNLSKFFEDLEDEMTTVPSGLSVSSDDKHIYIDAHVPGLTAKDIEVSIDSDNVLWIKGDKKEESEDKEKKYYRRSQSSFSYCVPLWEEVDETVEPEAVCKDGIMRVKFSKKKGKQIEAKKIKVKED